METASVCAAIGFKVGATARDTAISRVFAADHKESEMKKNVQVYTSEQIRTILQGDCVLPKPCCDPQILANGDFFYSAMRNGKWVQNTFTANDVANFIDMPLWEVVMVDDCGMDRYALLFYEE